MSLRFLNRFTFSYTTRTIGSNFEHRTFLVDPKRPEKQLSFWNDIPLRQKSFGASELNACIEIPQHRIAKLEMAKDELSHPIKQDIRKNRYKPEETELRYYAQFPLFNYGFLPQTWESSIHSTPEGFQGDDDPIDILELGKTEKHVGQIVPVKILGCFCLIDQGEVDWKVITINSEEANAKKIETLEDYERVEPGRLASIKNWFKFIKTYDGKKANSIHYNEQIFNTEKALSVIQETHEYWHLLQNPSKLTGDAKIDQALEKKRKSFHFN